jgi:MSHA biogenesis protein MshI
MPFFKRKEQPGLLAIVPRKQRMEFAHVVRAGDAKPAVLLLESTSRAGNTDTEALLRARKALHLQGYRCTTWIEPGSYQMIQVAAPSVPEAEMRSALRWSVKDSLDFPVEQAMIDVLPIPTDGMPAGREPLALVVAAKRQPLADRVQAFQHAHMNLGVIDVLETAQRNVAALFETPGRGLAMLGFYENGSLLTFTKGGELYGLRYIDIKAEALNDASQRDSVFERLGLELQRSLDGFDRQFSQVPMQRVLLAGHKASEALSNYLKDNIYIPVEVADLANVMTSPDPYSPLSEVTEQSVWYTSIGMALRVEDAPKAAA